MWIGDKYGKCKGAHLPFLSRKVKMQDEEREVYLKRMVSVVLRTPKHDSLILDLVMVSLEEKPSVDTPPDGIVFEVEYQQVSPLPWLGTIFSLSPALQILCTYIYFRLGRRRQVGPPNLTRDQPWSHFKSSSQVC